MIRSECIAWLKLYRDGGDMHTVSPVLFKEGQVIVPPKSFELSGETIDFILEELEKNIENCNSDYCEI